MVFDFIHGPEKVIVRSAHIRDDQDGILRSEGDDRLRDKTGIATGVPQHGFVFTTVIPPLNAQRITNTGITDLVFLAVCSPRFIPGAYEDIEPDAIF